MNSSEQHNSNPFIPLITAISDTFLQMRAKPLIFLALWCLLTLPPQLLFYLALRQTITQTPRTSSQIFGEMPDSDFQIAEQESGVMKNSRMKSVILALMALAIYVYHYSVLGDVIAMFRRKLLPKITQSLTEGLRGYVNLLKVILVSIGRIALVPAVIMILGEVIAGLLKQETLAFVVFTIALVMLLINQLRYGLAPFVHLSLGTVWRSSLAISKSYYQTHRLRVLVLFGFVNFLPFVIFTLLNKVTTTIAFAIVSGVFQSIVGFFMGGVLINFGMNNFIPESSGGGIEEGGDSRQVETAL